MQQQRLRFCEAAMACFRRKGVIASNLTDICEEAGLSMGALYKHFTSRDDLLEGVLQLLLNRRNAALNGSTWPELRNAVVAYRQELTETPFWRELDGAVEWNPRLKELRLREGHTILDQLDSQLAGFTRAGEIAPPFDTKQTAQLVSLIFDGSLSNIRASTDISVSPADLGRYLDWAVGLAPSSGTKKK